MNSPEMQVNLGDILTLVRSVKINRTQHGILLIKKNIIKKRKSESRRLHTSYLKRMSVKRKLQQDPLYIRKNNLKSQFSMTIDEYDELFKKCNNSCQICNIDAESHYKKEGRNLCIDHDHKTGKIRGLLCNQCNSALGKFKDSEELLLKAINYLKETL